MGAVPAVAYLAEGKLYVVTPGDAPRLVESPFVQELLDRAERNRQRNELKREGMSWNLGGRGMVMHGMPAEVRRVHYTGVAAGAGGGGGELFYAIDSDHVSGLFAYDLAGRAERRILHKHNLRPRDLSRRPGDGTLALSVRADDGSAHIATMEAAGRGLREVTEGDCIDEAPAWVGGDGKVLLFQSAGIGRNQHGWLIDVGPYAVQRLDLAGGEMTTLAEDPAYDYLLPRASADGALYCIRRPYASRRPKVSPVRLLGDIVLFPFRVARAVVHFLNFFSLMFARKPLLTAGGPPKEGPDARYLMLWGKMVDAEKALRQSKDGDGRSLVPATWQLIRRTEGGQEEVLAKSVLAYDLLPDGSVVYSNGTTIFHRDPAGAVTEVCTGKLIERVVAVR